MLRTLPLSLTVAGLLTVLPMSTFAQPASCGTATAPSLPSTTAILTSATSNTLFDYKDNNGGSANEQTGTSYDLPYTFTADMSTNVGAFSNPSTFPTATNNLGYWIINSSASTGGGGASNTGCTPGVNCDSCDAVYPPGSYGDYDCTGQHVARWPAIGLTSANYSSITGFQWTGDFAGNAYIGTGSGAQIVPAIYYHESPILEGGPEFGIYSSFSNTTSPGGPSKPIFYYVGDNSNCTDIYGNSTCSDVQEGGTGTNGGTGDRFTDNTSPGFQSCTLSATTGTSSETYSVLLAYDSGVGHQVFYITLTNAGVTYMVDPSVSYYQQASYPGYVTAGVVHYDPNDTAGYSTTLPALAVSSAYIFN